MPELSVGLHVRITSVIDGRVEGWENTPGDEYLTIICDKSGFRHEVPFKEYAKDGFQIQVEVLPDSWIDGDLIGSRYGDQEWLLRRQDGRWSWLTGEWAGDFVLTNDHDFAEAVEDSGPHRTLRAIVRGGKVVTQ